MKSGERHWLADEPATEALARALAPTLPRPCVLYLQGDLGAGKTAFTRYLLRALGHTGPVKSPTYTLLEPYDLVDGPVYHFDLYRIDDPLELELAGFSDLFAERALCVIEWPERGAPWLPSADVRLRFAIHGVAREVWIDRA